MNKIYLTEKQITLIKEHLNARVNPDDINDIEYYVNEPEDEDDELNFDIECWDKKGDKIYSENMVYVSELNEIFGERIADMIRNREGQFSNNSYMLSDIMNSSVSNPDDVDEVNAVAKKVFPSYDFYSKDMRGYILTDGSVLYFGDNIDHASINWVDGMTVGKFVGLGNIRIGHQSFELAKYPTDKQMYLLKKLISSYRNDWLYVDIIDYQGGTYGKVITSAQYQNPTVEWVMGEINRYFMDGENLLGECNYKDGDVLAEMAYPITFNMEEFKNITSYSGRIKYCQERLHKLGAGSSRVVFQIDDDKCLKLAKNAKGIAQNAAETDKYLEQIGIAATTYDYHPDYQWIEMQLARRAKQSDFKKLTPYDFYTFCAWVDYIHSQYSRQRRWRDTRMDELFKSENFWETIEYTLFDEVQEYLSNYTLEATGDLQRISSWGVVKDNNGEERLVLIDYGLTDDVAKQYYRMVNESMTANEIDQEVKKVNTNPSEKQKKSGNYKMGHINVLGFNITVENPKGSYRRGKDNNGKEWKVKMQNHYGYFTKTKGKDGDHIDVFVGKHLDSEKVFVVDQVNLKGEFDESKVMLGFRNAKEAKNAYLSNYSKGWRGFKEITGVSLDTFKEWLYDGYRQRKPFAEYVQIKKNTLNEAKLLDWLTKNQDNKIPSIKGKTFKSKIGYFIIFSDNTTDAVSILDTMRDGWVSINGRDQFKRVVPADDASEFAIDFGDGRWHEVELEDVRERKPNLQRLEYKWR